MIRVSIEEIQRDPMACLSQVQAGQTVLVTRAGRTVAEIRPIADTIDRGQSRPFGLCAGEFVVPDDFDGPLPEEILKQFEGK